MRASAYMLGGLLVWTVHFFGIYVAGSIFLTSDTTRLISALLTIVCLAAAAVLALLGWKRRKWPLDPFGRWTHRIAGLGAAAAFVAIIWQALPALLT